MNGDELLGSSDEELIRRELIDRVSEGQGRPKADSYRKNPSETHGDIMPAFRINVIRDRHVDAGPSLGGQRLRGRRGLYSRHTR